MLLLSMCCGLSCATHPAGQESEIVVYTAREIVTLDESRPQVEAVAVDADRIIATGSVDEIRRKLRGRRFRIDHRFKDHVLVPGLINQHEHAWIAALVFMTEIISIEDWVLPGQTIRRAVDAEDYRRRLQEVVDRHLASPSARKDVLYTWGFHQLFHGELSRTDLDEISKTIPIVVIQRSVHELILNSRALEYFGIDQSLIDQAPESVRAQTDLSRGHFWEQGQAVVFPAVFKDLFVPSRYLPALQQVEDYWHAAGSTLVAEPGGLVSPALIAMQNQVMGDDATPFRMHYIADGKTMVARHPEDRVIEETEKLFDAAKGMTRFLPKQVKLFADGAIFSQLMKMKEGYLDGHEGEWLMQPDDFAKAFRIYWEAGYQIHIHQNGDAGLDLVLDNLELNMNRNPRVDHRTVIVHFGFSRPDQVDRLARLGAIVSANPFYPIVLADPYSRVGIGPERSQEMVRLGDVVRAGVSISLHADMPMAPGQPLLLMSSAVNRITVGGNIAGPRQRISPLRALRAITIDAAYSLRLENEVGSIEPGKLANMTVLAKNPLRVDPQSIDSIQIWGTIHEGRVRPVRAKASSVGAVGELSTSNP
jgi:predicted amidohydrolase YtcJ